MPERLVTIKIDGRDVEAREGELLIRVLRDMGIRVPTLCHDERLTPYGGCRLCVVERKDGRGGLLPTCSTPVLPGMEILTDTAAIRESRRRQLQLLIANHRMECPVCDRRGDCRLQDLVYEYGAPEDGLPFTMERRPKADNSPVIMRDPEKCIVCGKCVRLCDEVQGVAAIGITHRGLEAEVETHLGQSLDCEFCGQCVNACPVGALILKHEPSFVPVWLRSETTTTCSYCSCGCQISAQVYDDEVVKVRGDETAEPNHGKLCVKGWLGWDVMTNEQRLTRPLVREKGKLVETTWERALDEAASLIRKTRDEGKLLAGVGTPRLSTEDAYLMQRLWRAGFQSPHVSSGPTGGIAAMSRALHTEAGHALGTASLDELRDADLVLVLRADPTRTHPLVKTELVQGARQREQQIVLAHSLSGGLEAVAKLHLVLKQGGETDLLHALSARLVELQPELARSIAGSEGSGAWIESLKAWTLEAAAKATSLEEHRLDELARRVGDATKVVVVVVTSLGVPGDEVETTRAASRLVQLLDAHEERSAGLMVLGGRANARGVVDAGLHPALLPGHRSLEDAGEREVVEKTWGGSIPAEQGIALDALAEAAKADRLGLLYLVGQDPAAGWPRRLDAESVLANADALIVHEAFLTSTARRAHVVFPVAILAERRGTMVAFDGQTRAMHAVTTPPAELPQDGDLLCEVARRAGVELPPRESLEAELAALVKPAGAQRSRAPFTPVAEPRPRARVNGALILDTSPTLFHSGTVTHRSRSLCELGPLVALRLSPRDAHGLGLRGGELVRVSSEVGETLLRARVDHTVRAGTAVATPSSRRVHSTSPLEREAGETRIQVRRGE